MSEIVATGEGRFTVDTAGPADGPLVLLLHGYPQTRHTWLLLSHLGAQR
ncbi:MAG: hypothetical protein ACREKB_04005 [Candidatus Rokuibacteriota bacterium]